MPSNTGTDLAAAGVGSGAGAGPNPAMLPTVGTPTLILLRHGRTVLNDQNKLQGVTDPALDEHGQEQSHKVGRFIRHFYHVDRVVSSPLKRTMQTIQHAGFDQLPMSQDARFAEINYGEWEGEPVMERAELLIEKWSTDPDFTPPGGESIASLFRRVGQACEDLMDSHQESTVLVCSHATPIKAAIIWALGGEPTMVTRIHSHPASISVIAQTDFGKVLVGYNERPQA